MSTTQLESQAHNIKCRINALLVEHLNQTLPFDAFGLDEDYDIYRDLGYRMVPVTVTLGTSLENGSLKLYFTIDEGTPIKVCLGGKVVSMFNHYLQLLMAIASANEVAKLKEAERQQTRRREHSAYMTSDNHDKLEAAVQYMVNLTKSAECGIDPDEEVDMAIEGGHCHDSVTPTQPEEPIANTAELRNEYNEYIDAKRNFHVAVANTLDNTLSVGRHRVVIDGSHDILLLDDGGNESNVEVGLALDLASNKPIVTLTTIGDVDYDIYTTLPATEEHVKLYNVMMAALNALLEAIRN